MDIHQRIKKARLAKGLSMEQVAEALGLKSWQTIQQWENGSTAPSRKRISAVAELLDLDETELVTGRSATQQWPFAKVSEEKVRSLSRDDLIRIETALLVVAADLGIDISTKKTPRTAA